MSRARKALPLRHPDFPGVQVPGVVTRDRRARRRRAPNPHAERGHAAHRLRVPRPRAAADDRGLRRPPTLPGCRVTVDVVADDGADLARGADERSRAALLDYFHPLTGGEDGAGWPFGGDDLLLARLPARVRPWTGVQSIERLVIALDGDRGSPSAATCRSATARSPTPSGARRDGHPTERLVRRRDDRFRALPPSPPRRTTPGRGGSTRAPAGARPRWTGVAAAAAAASPSRRLPSVPRAFDEPAGRSVASSCRPASPSRGDRLYCWTRGDAAAALGPVLLRLRAAALLRRARRRRPRAHRPARDRDPRPRPLPLRHRRRAGRRAGERLGAPGMALRAAWTLPADPPRRAHRGARWPSPSTRAAASGSPTRRTRWSTGLTAWAGCGRASAGWAACGTWRWTAPAGSTPSSTASPARAACLDPDGAVLPAVDDPETLRGRFRASPSPWTHWGGWSSARCAVPPRAASAGSTPRASATPRRRRRPPSTRARDGTWARRWTARIHRCQWHRVVIRGQVPEGASLRVATTTAEAVPPPGYLEALPESSWATGSPCARARTASGTRSCAAAPAATSGCGWTSRATGTPRRASTASPSSTRASRCAATSRPCWARSRSPPTSPTASWPCSTPASARWSAGWTGSPRCTTRSRPPRRRRADFLSWIGEWIGVTLGRQWPEALRRAYLKRAAALFHLRGTRGGAAPPRPASSWGWKGRSSPSTERATRCDAPPGPCGRPWRSRCGWQPPPLILEHFQLRRWLFLGGGRLGDDAVLWGQKIVNRSQLTPAAAPSAGRRWAARSSSPRPTPLRDPFHVYAHRFSVFVPAARGARGGPAARAGAADRRRERRPTRRGSVEYVEPRFRIGVQSRIGLDAVVGRYPRGVELDATRLGPASVLEGGPAAGGPRIGAYRAAGAALISQRNERRSRPMASTDRCSRAPRARRARSRGTTTSPASCWWSGTSPTSSATSSTSCATTTSGCTAGAWCAASRWSRTPTPPAPTGTSA